MVLLQWRQQPRGLEPLVRARAGRPRAPPADRSAILGCRKCTRRARRRNAAAMGRRQARHRFGVPRFGHSSATNANGAGASGAGACCMRHAGLPALPPAPQPGPRAGVRGRAGLAQERPRCLFRAGGNNGFTGYSSRTRGISVYGKLVGTRRRRSDRPTGLSHTRLLCVCEALTPRTSTESSWYSHYY